MVTVEEFEQRYEAKALIRECMKTEDSYTQQLATKVKEVSALFCDDCTEVKFKLLQTLVTVLHMFAGECRGQGVCNIANPAVWGRDHNWLSTARDGIMQIFTQKRPLPQDIRVLALRMYDLLTILFGEHWSWSADGKFAQLVIATCQVELEITLESTIYEMESAAESGSTGCTGHEARGAAPVAASATTEPAYNSTENPTTQTAPQSVPEPAKPNQRLTLLTSVCSILQSTIKFLTAEEVEGERRWATMPPDTICGIYKSLVSAYSNVLNYFIARQGTVNEDVDVVCVGLLEDLMQDLDADLFAEEAETVREMLHKSGYFDPE